MWHQGLRPLISLGFVYEMGGPLGRDCTGIMAGASLD